MYNICLVLITNAKETERVSLVKFPIDYYEDSFSALVSNCLINAFL